MTEPNEQPTPSDDAGSRGPQDEASQQQVQQVQVSGVTARVPSYVGSGVVSTGVIVMNGPHMFVLDFLQQMGVPSQLVSRVIVPHQVLPRMINALEQNLNNYRERFGAPMQLPKPQMPSKPPSVEEIYDNIKIPDDQLCGRFAEGILIRHSAAEFCFDFVTQFYPNAAVTSRVFMSAPHVPPLLEALKNNYQRFLEAVRRAQAQADPPPPNPPTADGGDHT